MCSSSNQCLSAVLPENKIVKIGSDPPTAKQNPTGRLSWEKKASRQVPCKNCLIPPRCPLQPGQTRNTDSRVCLQRHPLSDLWTSEMTAAWWAWCNPPLHSLPCSRGDITHHHHSYGKKEKRFFFSWFYLHLFSPELSDSPASYLLTTLSLPTLIFSFECIMILHLLIWFGFFFICAFGLVDSLW